MIRLARYVVAACVAGAACSLGSCKSEGAGPGEGTLSGRVTSQGGEGVSNALLTLGPGSGVATATSDSSGAYHFTAVPGGEYQLALDLPFGYLGPGNVRHFVADPGLHVQGSTTRDVAVAAVVLDSAAVPAGATDSLALKGGTVVTVQATGGDVSLTASVVAAPSESQDQTVLAPTIRLTFGPGAGSARGARVGAGASGVLADVKVAVTTVVNQATVFLVNVFGTPMWANATGTTVVINGQSRTVPLISLQVDPATVTSLDITLLGAFQDCSEPKQVLRPFDDTPLNGRIPLILVHGWDPSMRDCAGWRATRDSNDPFANLIAEVSRNSEVASRYKTYLFRYATFEQVVVAADALYSIAQTQGLTRPVVIGHSMGGLVGRALLARKGFDALRGLITLSTPHGGSPLADLVEQQRSDPNAPSWLHWYTCLGHPVVRLVLPFGSSIVPATHGLSDLQTNSDLVVGLGAASGQVRDRVFAFGGNGGGGEFEYDNLHCLLSAETGGAPNDGVVTVSSSLPSWSALQLVRDGYNHGQMATGVAGSGLDDPLFADIRSLLASLAACGPAPAIPDRNAFPVSGSILRTGDRRVQAVLNPVLQNGRVVTGLTKANIQVIEDGCVQDFDFTTMDGHIPVDIAFIQDVSGSMGFAIAGVRTSVIAFAQQLQSMGVDARLASVGFSGNGTIASTPANAPQEFLGPVQDFTTPVAFQQFVSANWTAYGGGDLRENDLEAIKYAYHNLSWRPSASHVYIVITDASVHQAGDSCDNLGACTDETLASISGLLAGDAVVHVVGSPTQSNRTAEGGLDPWLLADATGGQKLSLGTNGSVDLTALGIANVIGQVMALTYSSSSDEVAQHGIRIRVTLPDGQVGELAPGMIPYAPPARPPRAGLR